MSSKWNLNCFNYYFRFVNRMWRWQSNYLHISWPLVELRMQFNCRVSTAVALVKWMDPIYIIQTIICLSEHCECWWKPLSNTISGLCDMLCDVFPIRLRRSSSFSPLLDSRRSRHFIVIDFSKTDKINFWLFYSILQSIWNRIAIQLYENEKTFVI